MPPTAVSAGLRTVGELSAPVELRVSGALPRYLGASTLFRIGPGRYEATHADGRTRSVRHWFDGYALLHAFALDAPRNAVSYRNRFLCDAHVRAVEGTPAPRYKEITFGRSDPCRSVLGKFFALWTPEPVDPRTGLPAPSNANVTVQTLPGKGTVARTDYNANVAIDEAKLEVDHFFSFGEMDPALKGQMTAAHGHYDPHTGDFFNYVYAFGGPVIAYKVFKIDKHGKTSVLATFKERPCYIHSFATTRKYVILCVWPLDIGGIAVLFNQSLMDAMKFKPHLPTKFYVISRDEGNVVATYTSESFFCFHTINAFDTDTGITIDLCHYKDAEVLDNFMLDYMRNESEFAPTTVVRFTLGNLADAIRDGPGKPRQATMRTLDEHTLELPRINPKYQRKDYQYVYGVTSTASIADEIAKLDVKSKKRKTWGIPGGVVGEPIFVPDPSGVAEDDGCLLSVVLDSKAKNSFMVVLDARSMKEVARATVPQVVPLGFHGMFKPSK